MTAARLERWSRVALLAASAAWLAIELGRLVPGGVTARVPGLDRPAGGAEEATGPLTGTLTRGDGQPADLRGAWPRFRGERLDNVSVEPVPLARSWSADGPPRLWSVELGEGYAGAAVRDGRVWVLDYDASAKADALRCLSLADGREIWRYGYPVKVKRNHGQSRTVPTVSGDAVVGFGPKSHVTCLDAATGELRWQLDLVRDFGATTPPWYAGQCPLVDGDRVILAPGAPDALLLAVDLRSGAVVWRTDNPQGWGMTHSSIVPATLAGRRMLTYCAKGGVVGVDPADGALLWKTTEWKIGIATVPSPVPIGDDRLFLCGGYNAGSLMLRIEREADRMVARTLWRLGPEVFGAAQQTPVLYRDHIYGVRPDGQLVCLDLDGRPVWTSGAAHTFGLGPFLVAQDLVFAMNDDGELTLARASPAGFARLAHAKVLAGAESWGPMALAGGRLLVRDLTRMVCLDVLGK